MISAVTIVASGQKKENVPNKTGGDEIAEKIQHLTANKPKEVLGKTFHSIEEVRKYVEAGNRVSPIRIQRHCDMDVMYGKYPELKVYDEMLEAFAAARIQREEAIEAYRKRYAAYDSVYVEYEQACDSLSLFEKFVANSLARVVMSDEEREDLVLPIWNCATVEEQAFIESLLFDIQLWQNDPAALSPAWIQHKAHALLVKGHETRRHEVEEAESLLDKESVLQVHRRLIELEHAIIEKKASLTQPLQEVQMLAEVSSAINALLDGQLPSFDEKASASLVEIAQTLAARGRTPSEIVSEIGRSYAMIYGALPRKRESRTPAEIAETTRFRTVWHKELPRQPDATVTADEFARDPAAALGKIEDLVQRYCDGELPFPTEFAFGALTESLRRAFEHLRANETEVRRLDEVVQGPMTRFSRLDPARYSFDFSALPSITAKGRGSYCDLALAKPKVSILPILVACRLAYLRARVVDMEKGTVHPAPWDAFRAAPQSFIMQCLSEKGEITPGALANTVYEYTRFVRLTNAMAIQAVLQFLAQPGATVVETNAISPIVGIICSTIKNIKRAICFTKRPVVGGEVFDQARDFVKSVGASTSASVPDYPDVDFAEANGRRKWKETIEGKVDIVVHDPPEFGRIVGPNDDMTEGFPGWRGRRRDELHNAWGALREGGLLVSTVFQFNGQPITLAVHHMASELGFTYVGAITYGEANAPDDGGRPFWVWKKCATKGPEPPIDEPDVRPSGRGVWRRK